MKTALFILAAIIMVAFALTAFRQLWRRRYRPGPSNNWKNEHFLAMDDDGTWAENSESVTHRDTNSSSTLPGLH